MGRILTSTLRYLSDKVCPAHSLTALHLTRYFCVAEVDHYHVGASCSYFFVGDNALRGAERVVLAHANPTALDGIEMCELDRALSEDVQDPTQRSLLALSVQTAILGAVSAPVIQSGGDEIFEVRSGIDESIWDCAETALVVGFGGMLERFLTAPRIRSVHILDLLYGKYVNFSRQLSEVQRRYPSKKINATSLLDDWKTKDFDVLSITASTLCNGTLERFLDNARADAVCILQGQSGGIHPKYLFSSGIALVLTTVKPNALINLAAGDYSGSRLRPLLESSVEPISLTPRAESTA